MTKTYPVLTKLELTYFLSLIVGPIWEHCMALHDNKIFIVGGATSKGYSNLVLIYNENDLNEDPKTGPSNIRASRSPACTIFERLQNILISKQNLVYFLD